MEVSGADGQGDAHVDSVEALVAALRTDPVNVQQVRGNGHTAEVDAEITQIVRSSDVPVYVALVGDLPDLAVDDPAGDLAVRLQAGVDPEAVYVVAVGDGGSPSWHYAGGDPDLEQAVRDGLIPTYPDSYDPDAPRASDAGEAAIIASVVAADDHTVSEDLVETYTEGETWTEPRFSGRDEALLPSEVSGLALGLGVLVALVAWRLARTWALRSAVPAPPPGARPTRRPRPSTSRRDATKDRGPDLEEVREDATRTLSTLARELAEQPPGDEVEDAMGCRVAAESVLGSDDLLDVVGALVLARTGRRLLDDPGRPYRPCFLNPLHGTGTVEIDAPSESGASVTVPVCRRCSRVAGSAQRYDPLLERSSGWLRIAARPYYEGDTVWARTGFGALDPRFWRRVTEQSA